MSVAIEGAKITRNASSGNITYVEFCEKCRTTGDERYASAGAQHTGNFTCKNCGNHQHIKIIPD